MSLYIGMCLFSSKPVIKSKFLLSVHAQNLALLPDPPSNLCVPVESQTCLNVYCLYVVTSSSHGWYNSDPLQVTRACRVPRTSVNLHCHITRGNQIDSYPEEVGQVHMSNSGPIETVYVHHLSQIG